MKRVELEKNYWNICALDPDVDQKYICDLDDDQRSKAIGKLSGRVLEIGCGIGRLLKPHWFGIDISQRMLDIAKQKRADCNFMLCNGRTIPYESEYFDNVYCVLVFQHIPFDGFVQYVQEVARVLKDSGQFVFQIIEGKVEGDFSQHYNLEEVLKTLKSAGFIVTSQKKGLVHEQWVWIKAKKGGNEASKYLGLKEIPVFSTKV